jgi:hypothetical protein
MNLKTRDEKRGLLARFKKPADLPLPKSGIIAEVVRPPVAGWIAAGEIPHDLFNTASAALQSGPQATAQAMNMPEVFGLALKIARAAFKWPRLTEEGQSAGEDEDMLDPATLPLEDLGVVLAFGFGESPGATVETNGGHVSADALRSFREDGGVRAGGGDGTDVRAEAVGAGGDS